MEVLGLQEIWYLLDNKLFTTFRDKEHFCSLEHILLSIGRTELALWLASAICRRVKSREVNLVLVRERVDETQ